MSNGRFRELSDFEKGILDLLLEKKFPGRDEMLDQITSCKVRDIFDSAGNYWGLEFKVKSNTIAHVNQRVPVEAIAYEDGIPVEILLHVVNGKIKELELVRYDNKPPKEFPSPNVLKIQIR